MHVDIGNFHREQCDPVSFGSAMTPLHGGDHFFMASS